MRQHFHRCSNLKVIAIEASDLSHVRKGGSQILDELCTAKNLARCVGLADCDILTPAQKRELLVARATRMRQEEGGTSALADPSDPRREELAELREALLEEREAIVEGNRRREFEAGGALQRNPRPFGRAEERQLAAAGVSIFLDADLRELRADRLDAIDRALDAMARGRFGGCARCGRAIDVERLRLSPDTAVCAPCAQEAKPEA
jgi:DnaK suppressor protein